MVAHIKTVAFLGVDAVAAGVQIHLAPCCQAFAEVSLPDESVVESRERVRAALSAIACSTALLIRKIRGRGVLTAFRVVPARWSISTIEIRRVRRMPPPR